MSHRSFSSLTARRGQARLIKGFSLLELLIVVIVIGISVMPTGASLAGASTPLNLTWNAGGTSYTFTQGIMFKPDREAVASATTWNTLVEFGIQPIRQSSKDIAVMRLTHLTGKLTVYRQ